MDVFAPIRLIVEFMAAGPPVVPFVLWTLVAAPVVVLLHEVGHAVAARALVGEDVDVVVGSAGRVADLHVRGVRMQVNAVTSPLGAAGSASFDAGRVTARDVVWIAAAGPAASAVGVAFTAALLAAAGPGPVHDLLWVATLMGVFGVLNLVPLRVRDRPGDASQGTDGWLILDALRASRGLVPRGRDDGPAVLSPRREALQPFLVALLVLAAVAALLLDSGL